MLGVIQVGSNVTGRNGLPKMSLRRYGLGTTFSLACGIRDSSGTFELIARRSALYPLEIVWGKATAPRQRSERPLHMLRRSNERHQLETPVAQDMSTGKSSEQH